MKVKEHDLYLRKVEPSDVDTLFNWVNDETTRQNAFETHHISYGEHVEWFNRLLNDDSQVQYLLMLDRDTIGQIRLSINESDVEIDYSISPYLRGYGYGKELIRLIIEQVKQDYPNITRLIARVKPSNVASYYCFIGNGFEDKYRQLEYKIYDNNRKDVSDNSTDIDNSWGGVKLLFLTNNQNALQLFEWISERCQAEIYSDRLDKKYLSSKKPDIVISYNYIYMISQECIDAVGGNIINMHISFLPWNRGFSPNIWSFIDDTPKGVTIHRLSAGLDEGDILFQEEVMFDPNKETFQTTHRKLNDLIVKLFMNNWNSIISGECKKISKKQVGKGSYHNIADLKKLQKEFPFEWSENISDFLYRYKMHNQLRV